VQTVSEKENKKFYKLINEFYKISNCPMLINTSLNINEPIAQSPSDAFYFFSQSKSECIVLNNWLIEKK
jgi:carbamoyltransferase